MKKNIFAGSTVLNKNSLNIKNYNNQALSFQSKNISTQKILNHNLSQKSYRTPSLSCFSKSQNSALSFYSNQQSLSKRQVHTSSPLFKEERTPFVSIEQRLKERKARPIHEVYDKFSDIEFSRHKTKVGFNHAAGTDESPFKIVNNAFIAPCATLVGNVEICDQSSVWFGSIIRADQNLVRIGGWTNIQDNCYITEVEELSDDHDGSTIIGSYVTIGHSCVLKGCTIESESLIGMGSVLEEGSLMEKNSMLGAGSVLAKNTRVGQGQLWMGSPAVYVRDLSEAEIDDIKRSAQKYRDLSWQYVEHFIPYMGASKQADDMGYNVGWKERGYGWGELGYKESDYLKEKDL